MAINAAQYQSMRLAFRIMLSVEGVGPTDGDVLAFSKQLFNDAAGATQLAAGRLFTAQEVFRATLSTGAFSPTDANITDFFTQLQADSSGTGAMGQTTRYRSMRNALRAAMPGGFLDADVNGFFAPFVGTPLTIITSAAPKLWVDSQLGTGVNAWVDQSGLGNGFTEATNPPTLTAVGGVPCYLGNGANQKFTSNNLTCTLGQWYWIIAQQVSWTANNSLCGGALNASACIFQTGSTPSIVQYNNALVNANASMTVGQWFRVKMLVTGTAADYIQPGPIGNKTTGGNAGGLTETGWNIFCRAGAFFGNCAIAAIVVCPAEPTAPEQTGLDAYGAARWPTVTF